MKKLSMESFYRAFEELRKVKPLGPASHLQVFLEVALEEGRTVSELAKSANVSMAAASRVLDELSAKGRNGKPGKNLIECYEGGVDARTKCHSLTSEGRAVISSVCRIMLNKPPRVPLRSAP